MLDTRVDKVLARIIEGVQAGWNVELPAGLQSGTNTVCMIR